MPLLALPDEILVQIVGELGLAFFRQDLERLTVCQRWYVIAQKNLLSHVSLCRKHVVRLLHRTRHLNPATMALPERMQLETHAVSVNLGYRLCLGEADADGTCAAESTRASAIFSRHDLLMFRAAEAAAEAATEHWFYHFFDQPRAISIFGLLEQFRRLRKLDVRFLLDEDCTDYVPADPSTPCRKAVHRLADRLAGLNFEALRELEISIPDGGVFRDLIRADGQCICAAVNRLLCRTRGLKHVHLQLAFACPNIFSPGPADAALALETLHLHCTYNNGCSVTAFEETTDLVRQNLESVKLRQSAANHRAREMAGAARRFATAAVAPKLVWIEWRDMYSDFVTRKKWPGSKPGEGRVYVCDALSDKVWVRSIDDDCRKRGRIVDLDEELERLRSMQRMVWRPSVCGRAPNAG